MEKANSQFTRAGWRWPKVRVVKIDQRCGTIFCRIPILWVFQTSTLGSVEFQGLLLLPSLLGILFAGAAYVPLPFAARPLHEVDFCFSALCHMVKYGWWRPMGWVSFLRRMIGSYMHLSQKDWGLARGTSSFYAEGRRCADRSEQSARRGRQLPGVKDEVAVKTAPGFCVSQLQVKQETHAHKFWWGVPTLLVSEEATYWDFKTWSLAWRGVGVMLLPLEKHSALSGVSEEYSTTGEIPGQKGDRALSTWLSRGNSETLCWTEVECLICLMQTFHKVRAIEILLGCRRADIQIEIAQFYHAGELALTVVMLNV